MFQNMKESLLTVPWQSSPVPSRGGGATIAGSPQDISY